MACNILRNALGHAARELAAVFWRERCPCGLHQVLQLFLRVCLRAAHTQVYLPPHIFDGIEIGRVGREIERADVLVMHEGPQHLRVVAARVVVVK